MIHRLVAKFDLPSYLPKPDEILDGVQWLRENPALAAGVMVGLTSYSVAKYYQLVADGGDEGDDTDEEEVTREEIARSISAIQLGLLKVGLRGGGTSVSTDTVDTLSSSATGSVFGGLRRRTSSVFKPVIEVRPSNSCRRSCSERVQATNSCACAIRNRMMRRTNRSSAAARQEHTQAPTDRPRRRAATRTGAGSSRRLRGRERASEP